MREATYINKLKSGVSVVALAGLLLAPLAPIDAAHASRPGNSGNTPAAERANSDNGSDRSSDSTQSSRQGNERAEEARQQNDSPSNSSSQGNNNSAAERGSDNNSRAEQASENRSSSERGSERAQEVRDNHGSSSSSTDRNNQRPDQASNQGGQQKIAICHRTNSATNPYVKNTVAAPAVANHGSDGHGGQHGGQVVTSNEHAAELKSNGTKWGDIIPHVEGITDGMNWTSEGQEVYDNDCQVATSLSDDDTDTGEDAQPEDDGEVLGGSDEVGGRGQVDADDSDVLGAATATDEPDELASTGGDAAYLAITLLISMLAGAFAYKYAAARQQKAGAIA